MSDITAVYLARQKSGLAACQKFFASYSRFPAGTAHELLVIYKGFPSQSVIGEWKCALAHIHHRSLEISDRGFDLTAYRAAMETCGTEYLAFFNSYSELLEADWLLKLRGAVQGQGIGIASATGSWESMLTNAFAARNARPSSLPARLRAVLCSRFFLPFPNPHVRTNAFMIRRSLMQRVWPSAVLAKRAAYLAENGKNSITRRVERLGFRAVVVDRFGTVHESQSWPESFTFRQGCQQNLMVADNQTNLYMNADSAERKRLSMLAWGERARPE